MSRRALAFAIIASLFTSADLRGEAAGSAVSDVRVGGGAAIPLRPRGSIVAAPASGGSRTPGSSNALTTVVGGLAVCLGIFFLVIWAAKRQAPQGMARLPAEVVESLGRAPLSGRQHLQLVRVGRKLVLLDVTPSSAEALTEITDPAEVDRLVGLCQQAKPSSVTASFREVLTEFDAAPAGKGFLGNTKLSEWELAAQAGRKRPTRREGLDG